MYVPALLCVLALQPVVNNGKTPVATHTPSQQPTHTISSANGQEIVTPSTEQGQAEANQHQKNSDDKRYAIEIKKQPSPEDTPLFKWYLLATAAGVAVNAFIWIAILRQTKLNVRQLRINFVTAKAAVRSARAAKKSADTAEMTLRLSERADILIDEAGLSTGKDITPETDVVITFKNFGRTRAQNVIFKVELVAPGIPDNQLPRGLRSRSLGPIILGAGATQSITYNLLATVAGTLQKILRAEESMGFDSEVSYVDTFGFPHTHHAIGTFVPGARSFRVEKNWGD